MQESSKSSPGWFKIWGYKLIQVHFYLRLVLSNNGRKMWRISLSLQWNISEYSKSIGSGRDKRFVGIAKCASYSITDSCQIYELAVCAKKAEDHVETINWYCVGQNE